MLGEEFETWPVDFFPDATLIIVGMHVTKLGYQEDKPPRFIEFPDGGTEESNRILVGLDTAAVIPETKNQDLPHLINSEPERANKKKEKAERHRQRKINLAQETAVGDAPSSPDASACRSLLSPIVSAGGAYSASAGGASLSPIARGSLLSAVSGRLSSLVAGGGPLYTILERLLSLVADDGPSSAVLGRFSSPVASDSP